MLRKQSCTLHFGSHGIETREEVARAENKELSEDQTVERLILKGVDFYPLVIGSHQKFLRKSDTIRFMI